MTAPLDLLVLGNAIVDLIARTDEAFLADQGVPKGAMALIDEPRAETLFAAMGPTTVV
ncbi:adenosine kinase, partial [Methylobacterium hispanicum]